MPFLLADHNPVMWIGRELNSTYQWRLIEHLLSKEENLEKLKKESKTFFKTEFGE